MTLDDVVAELPNGLHDAFLRTLTIDYAARRATFTLRVWVGDPHAVIDAEREAYRPATIRISGLLWCIIESPERIDGLTAEELWIDAGPLTDLKKRPAVPSVPADAFAWWIFVQQWNAFLYIAGRTASIES